MSAPTVEVGTKLPELSLYGDPTFIISTAIATRDYQDVHHDRDKAQAKGSKDIFVNILSDTGLVQRYITDWAGPSAIIKSIGLRLGVPWYAYDTVTFKGEVTAVEDGLITLKIVGSNSLGDHVIANATLSENCPARRRSSASVRRTSPRTPAAASFDSRPRPSWTRSTMPVSHRVTWTAWSPSRWTPIPRWPSHVPPASGS